MSNTQRRYDRDRDRREERDRRDRDRRDERDRRDAGRGSRSSYALRRVGWVAGGVGALALLISLTSGPEPKRPPAPEHLGSLSLKRVTEHVADNAVVGAALAAERAVAAREGRPTDRPVFVHNLPPGVTAVAGNGTMVNNGTVITVRDGAVTTVHNGTVTMIPSRARPGLEGSTLRLSGVRSRDAHSTQQAATADAIAQARDQLGEQLALLDPPITRRPSLDAVRDQYVFPKSARVVHPDDGLKAEWAKAKLDPDLVWVEVDVEVTPKQLQQLRGEGRTAGVVKVLGAIVFVLVGLAGFFRLDAATKGHLTGVLAVGGVALGTVAAGVAVYFARAGVVIFG